MEDVILKVNTHRTDLKTEFKEVLGIDLTGWDTQEWYFENDKVVISWVGDYLKPGKATTPDSVPEMVNAYPGFKFALIRWKGEGELDLKGSTRLSKLVEPTPIRVFL